MDKDMGYFSDIEIAQSVTPKPIEHIADVLGVGKEDYECYGKTKAKISLDIKDDASKKDGKLIINKKEEEINNHTYIYKYEYVYS